MFSLTLNFLPNRPNRPAPQNHRPGNTKGHRQRVQDEKDIAGLGPDPQLIKGRRKSKRAQETTRGTTSHLTVRYHPRSLQAVLSVTRGAKTVNNLLTRTLASGEKSEQWTQKERQDCVTQDKVHWIKVMKCDGGNVHGTSAMSRCQGAVMSWK